MFDVTSAAERSIMNAHGNNDHTPPVVEEELDGVQEDAEQEAEDERTIDLQGYVPIPGVDIPQ
ncbi:MAG: hypothetical protein K2W82_16725 [Candidatus Obscuribacterales bacterium]|nr:hypothetical protein [Candidatus Obscuribacterales bacterium]